MGITLSAQLLKLKWVTRRIRPASTNGSFFKGTITHDYINRMHGSANLKSSGFWRNDHKDGIDFLIEEQKGGTAVGSVARRVSTLKKYKVPKRLLQTTG